MAQSSNREDEIEREIEKKIKTMNSDSYDPGPPLNKIDITFIIIIAVVSFVGLIWGAM